MIKAYDIIKAKLTNGSYKLDEMLTQIAKMFLLGELDEAQMDELRGMAVDGVSADAERPETLALIQALADKMAALEARVADLERNTSGDVEEESGEQPKYPEWQPWDGISKDYAQGAIVTYNGELWESVYDGQNVWQPGVVGTESLWKRVE